MTTGQALSVRTGTVRHADGEAVTVRPAWPEIRLEDTAPPLYWGGGESYTANLGPLAWTSRKCPGQTTSIDRDSVLREIARRVSTIWDSSRLRDLLAAPLGAPVELTDEEAEEIVRLAAGRRPDLTPGREYVAYVRTLLGHSILHRRKGRG